MFLLKLYGTGLHIYHIFFNLINNREAIANMATKKIVTYVIIFNLILIFALFLSSQFVLSAIERRGEIVGEIGIISDTHYNGPMEYTPTYSRNDLLNYPLIIFIAALIGNTVFVLQIRRKNKSELRSKISS